MRVEGGPRPGAGFLVAPGLVLTCAHVVGSVTSLMIRRDHAESPPVPAKLELILREQGRPIPDLDDDYPDLALLRVELRDHPCVALDEDWPSYDAGFQIYGYPSEGGSVVLTPARLSYRGKKASEPTVFIDVASDTVKPGMSGAALLNLQSGGVCGVVVATRNPASPDGGLVVPWIAVRDPLQAVMDANRAFHRGDTRWATAARAGAGRIRFRLPRVVEHFAGRTVELAGLELVLGQATEAAMVVSLTGLGGVGKSQLAAAFVRAHMEDYDTVAWVRAEEGGLSDLAALAVELGLPVNSLAPEDRASRALRWLETSDRPWLLVLDNVADPAHLAVCCPTSGRGQVLVTSRQRDFEQFGPVVSVGVFDAQTAEDYLVERTGRTSEREAARRLAVALGCLPLALSHAAAYCAVTTNFGDYLDLLEDLPAPEVFDNPDAFHAQTVASTWQVSIEAAQKQAPLAGHILAMAAFLGSEAIPRSLFSVLVDGQGARQRKHLADGLGALSRFSLAEMTDVSVNVHRLLQKVVRDDAGSRNDNTGALAALRSLSAAFPVDVEVPAWWAQCEQLVSHVLAIGDRVAFSGEAALDLVRLLIRASDYLLHSGGGERAVVAAEAIRAVAASQLGPDDPHTLTARNNLMLSYRSVGRTAEAIAIGEHLVVDSERLLGVDHEETLTFRENLASAYESAGRTAEAIALGERVVADRKRLLGPDHYRTLDTMNTLAVSYLSAARIAEAIALGERVLADRERLLGPDNAQVLATRGNLALFYWSAGRSAEAIALGERVLADRERLLGVDHPDTLVGRSVLVGFYRKGRSADAIAMGERLVADWERLLGPDNPQTLIARGNLASAYQSAGRRAEAIAIDERVAADCERVLGPDHPDTLTARDNLASSYRSAGRTAEAIAMEERVAADIERLRGADHPDTLTARGNLASSYRSAGRTAEAIAIEERVAADIERLLGPEHPDTLTAWARLASSYKSGGRRAEAMAIEERVAVDSERLLGHDHPETLSSLASLAVSYWSAGRATEAIALEERVVADRHRLLGADHPDTLSARVNLAALYQSGKRTTEAIALGELVLADSERLLGADHPDTLTARENLAYSYRSAGRTTEAIAIEEACQSRL